MKLLCVCGNGMGTSIMLKLRLQDVLENLHVMGAEVESCSTSEAQSVADDYDVIIAPLHLVSELEDYDADVIGVKNIMDEDEMREKIEQYIKSKQ